MAFIFDPHENWPVENSGHPDPETQREYFIWAEDIQVLESFFSNNFVLDEGEEVEGVRQGLIKGVKLSPSTKDDIYNGESGVLYLLVEDGIEELVYKKLNGTTFKLSSESINVEPTPGGWTLSTLLQSGLGLSEGYTPEVRWNTVADYFEANVILVDYGNTYQHGFEGGITKDLTSMFFDNDPIGSTVEIGDTSFHTLAWDSYRVVEYNLNAILFTLSGGEGSIYPIAIVPEQNMNTFISNFTNLGVSFESLDGIIYRIFENKGEYNNYEFRSTAKISTIYEWEVWSGGELTPELSFNGSAYELDSFGIVIDGETFNQWLLAGQPATGTGIVSDELNDAIIVGHDTIGDYNWLDGYQDVCAVLMKISTVVGGNPVSGNLLVLVPQNRREEFVGFWDSFMTGVGITFDSTTFSKIYFINNIFTSNGPGSSYTFNTNAWVEMVDADSYPPGIPQITSWELWGGDGAGGARGTDPSVNWNVDHYEANMACLNIIYDELDHIHNEADLGGGVVSPVCIFMYSTVGSIVPIDHTTNYFDLSSLAEIDGIDDLDAIPVNLNGILMTIICPHDYTEDFISDFEIKNRNDFGDYDVAKFYNIKGKKYIHKIFTANGAGSPYSYNSNAY